MVIVESKKLSALSHHYDLDEMSSYFSSSADVLEAIRILENYQLIQDLEEHDKALLIKHIKIKKYYHNQLIYKQNTTCHDINLILDDVLKLGWTTSSGKCLTDAFLPAGMLINIVPIFSNRPFVHDYFSQGSTVIANISADIFKRVIQNNAKALTQLLKLICARTQINREKLFFYSTASLRTRLAKELLFLVDFHSQQDNNQFLIKLKLNQENFAELLGTTRQSINKEFAWFSEHEILEVKYNQILILNYDALNTIAQGENSLSATKFY